MDTEYPEKKGGSESSRLKILEKTLDALHRDRELAERLEKHNLQAMKMANEPNTELMALQKRYEEKVAGIDSAIRKTEKKIESLQLPTDKDAIRILIVDDEKNIRMTLSQSLESLGLPIETAVNGEEALRKLEDVEFTVLLLDLKMPGIGGMGVLHEVRKRWPGTLVIIITAHGTIDTAVEAMKLGAADFIRKPFSPVEIRELVKQVLKKKKICI